ncbi:response regulator [Pontibacter sp. JAM-7]|uniref:response regulator n=1 Tax=Pontibacter sp. JAM-7 TaxID=3366581 RepID=UPI003AF453D7
MQTSFLRYFLQRFLYIMLAAAVIAGPVLFIEENQYLKEEQQLHQQSIASIRTVMQQRLASLSSDLSLLLIEPRLWAYTENPSQYNRTQLLDFLTTFINVNRRYHQIRLLSAEGMEQIRINYRGGGARITQQGQLQNKQERSYFQGALELAPELTYVSGLELNEEHGEVEVPWKPTIRLVQKLYSTRGELNSILVMNFMGERLIEPLRSANAEHTQFINFAIVDEQGRWVFDSTGQYSWSAQRGLVEQFSEMYPDFWGQAKGQQSGQFVRDGTLYTSEKIRYPVNVPSYSALYKEVYLVGMLDIRAEWFNRLSWALSMGLIFLISGAWLLAYFWARSSYDRQLSQNREKRQALRLEKVVATALDGLIVISQRGIVIEYNPAAERIFGYSRDEVIGNNIKMLTPEPVRTEHDGYLKGYIDRGEARVLDKYREVVGQHKDGTPIDIQLAVSEMQVDDELFFVGSVLDITERKALERERKEYNQKLEQEIATRTLDLNLLNQRMELAVNNGEIGVWEYDPEEGKLIWNDWMFRIHGVSEKDFDLQFQSWKARIHPDDRFRVERNFARAVNSGELLDLEFRVQRPSGELRTVNTMASVCFDDHTQRMIGIMRDITPEKEATTALEQAKDMAIKAAQAKSEFIANMSHEIRTPMNAVLGLTYLLDKPDFKQEVRQVANKIQRAGKSLQSIINDVLDFSKIEAGKIELAPSAFSMQDLLNNISVIMSANTLNKNLELVIRSDLDRSLMLHGDATRIEQVIINLVGNAVKFTEQGYVLLSLQQLNADDQQLRIRVAVEDSGIGMTEETQSRILSAFEQADASTTRRFGGTGLGLTISTRLLALMGSELKVDSTLGVGSTFSFELQLKRESDLDVTAAQPSHLDILIAEDHEVARDALAHIAKSLGWHTTCVENGEQAVEQVLSKYVEHKPQDLVLLDWHMPELDGLAAAKKIKTAIGDGLAPVVIMVSGYARDQILAAPEADYVDAVLEKPITASVLYDTLMRIKQPEAANVFNRQAQAPQSLAGIRLLIVDDNEFNRDVAERIFTGHGAVTRSVNDGQQALDWLAENKDQVDLVLMDIQMPVLDGYQATQAIRTDESLKHLPVIALTAGAFESDRRAAMEAEMNGFISKPFDVNDAINSILNCVVKPKVDRVGPAFEASMIVEDEQQVDHAAVEITAEPLPILFDYERAVSFWGDEATLLHYIGKFLADYGDVIAQMAELPDSEAGRLAHKLKGASGSLAMDGLVQAASAVQRLGEEPIDREQVVTELHDCVCATFAAIEAKLGLSVGPVTESEVIESEVTGRGDFDKQHLSALFMQVLQQLDHDNPVDVAPLLEQLIGLIGEQTLQPVLTAVDDFEFRTAELEVRAIAAKQQIELGGV